MRTQVTGILVSLIVGNCAFAQSTVRIWDGTDIANVTGGALDVNATISTAGLATEAKQDTGNTSLSAIDGKITACNTGAVVVSSAPTTAVTGTFWQATQPVSGTLTCNAGTNLNTSALATEATLSTLNGKVTACNTGSVTVISAPTTAVTQSGTWTVQPGNTANTTAWKVDGSAVTQPVSGTFWQATQPVSLVSVPSHAVTNAGTFATQESGALLTSSQLIDDAVATTAAAIPTKGLACSATDGTNARIIKSDTSGELQVDVLTMPTTAVTGTFWQATQPVSISGNQAVNVAQINGVTPLMGAGNTGTGSHRVTIASDQAAIPVSQSGTWTVQPGNTPNTTAWLTQNTPATTGGFTTYHLVSAATTNATVVKASAGQLYGWYIYNSNAAARKLVFHNAASTPTAGASVFFSIMLPAGAAANVFNDTGIPFSTGIAITTVTGIADSDTAAVELNDLTINLFYK